MEVGGPPDGPAMADEHAAYQAVRAVADRAVPVVGAGLAAPAGAPSAAALRAALADELEAAGEAVAERESLFDLADRLAAVRGPAAVTGLVAAQYQGPFTATPALLALVHVPSGRIVTTNYDEAIEYAARQAGLEPRSFTPATINEFLQPVPAGAVHMLHLHGWAWEPAGIILDTASYQRVVNDTRVQAGLRALAMSPVLVFFGHSLDPREVHLRRDVLWARTSFARAPRHLLVHRAGGLDADRVASIRQADINPLAVDDPAGRYWFVGHLAGILGGQSAVTADQHLPLAPPERDSWYEPVRLVAHEQVATAEQRQAFDATDGLFTRAPADGELQAPGRLLLVGGPGYGKSRLVRELGRQKGQIGRAVLVRLRHVHPGPPGADPVAVLRTWLADGVALGLGVPRPGYEQLVQGTYTLLLDGLDEVPADERHAVVELIVQVTDRLPQHRVVLTSRPLELLDTLNTAGFARYDLRPTDRWLRRYLQQRGLDPAELDQLTGAVPAIAELCRIPLFAAAAVDRYYQDAPPPATPLELALAYADTGLDIEEGRLLAPDPAAVRSWLERLALTMELAGVATVDRASAAGAGLERGLDLPEMQGLLDHLVERALLSEDGVEVGFHSGVVQEARAVKALLDAPGGLELLDGHVLVDVDETEERGVRPSWGHSIELLAAAAPPAWRERIAAYDPLVVARTIPPGGSVVERSAAIATIWAWYDQHRVWLPRDRPGQLLDDLRTIRLLSTDGITDELRNRLRAATTGSDPAARGNAIAVLVAIDDVDAARAALVGLLADPDPVVRRRAAAAAWDLNSAEALPALRQQLAVESDDLARRTLAQAMVAVTPDDQVTGLLTTLPAGLRPHVWMVLDHRWSPAEQLRRLADV